jgi:hypothetical protein
MLCDRCHQEVGEWDEDEPWDIEEDHRPTYGPRTELQQHLVDSLLNRLNPKFRFKEFEEVKNTIKHGDTIEVKK